MSHTTTVKTVQIKSVSALKKMAINLKNKGLNVELVENAVPRMYYKDQIARTLKKSSAPMQYHSNVEECDFVLVVKDSYYDIGFLKNVDGEYVPLFDNFSFPSPYHMGDIHRKPLIEITGVTAPKSTPKKEIINYSIGKVLQEYSLCATVEACEEAGYTITKSIVDEHGSIHIEVEV